MRTINQISPQDRKVILKKLNQNGRAVVVVQKNGHLRVYDPVKYYGHKKLMRQVIQGHKPWTRRQKSILGPIGSKTLGVPSSISRTAIYED